MNTSPHAITLLLAAAAAPAFAEPIKFVNDGSLIWSAGNNGVGPPYHDVCDPTFPTNAFRSLDFTRGPEQFAPLSVFPVTSTSLCYQDRSVGTPSGSPQTRTLSIPRGNSQTGAIAMRGTFLPVGLVYGAIPYGLLAPFAPGMVVGPGITFSDNLTFANTPYFAANPAAYIGRPDLWLIAPRQFIGFRFDLYGATHYGWMLVQRNGDELIPLEWAYESTPNTPIRILSTQVASPFIPASTSILSIDSQTLTAHYLAGPATGPFAAPFTPADFDAARAGPTAFRIARHSDWWDPFIGPARTWISTSSSGNEDRTALFAINFVVPANFNPALTAAALTLDFSTSDRLGPLNSSVPGIYINGQPVPGATSGIGKPYLGTRFESSRVGPLLHPGINTIYLYNVNYGTSAPEFSFGSAILPMINFTFSSHPSLTDSAAIFPTSATIVGGSSLQLYGGVLSADSTTTTWSATGGSVSPLGLFTAPIAAGTYTVTLASAADPSLSASATITVTQGPCPADFNHDNALDPDDLSDFIACYFAFPPCAAADFNHDNVTDPDDLSDYIGAFFNGC